jgi:hypothetical protein
MFFFEYSLGTPEDLFFFCIKSKWIKESMDLLHRKGSFDLWVGLSGEGLWKVMGLD